MAVKKEFFGQGPDGTAYDLYTVDNGRMSFSVTNLGACLVRVMVPGAADDLRDDVVLGYDGAEGYLDNPDFYGALVGPSANRVYEGRVPIDGVTYRMDLNDKTNNLHTDHADGLHKRKWQAEVFENENRVTFTIRIPDGVYHLPGNREFRVSYVLSDSASLKDTTDQPHAFFSLAGQKKTMEESQEEMFGSVRIEYYGTSDKNTLMNLTNHSYFNLCGHGVRLSADGNVDENRTDENKFTESNNQYADITGETKILPKIFQHRLKLNCSYFTPIDEKMIPTGEMRPVQGTAFDFLTLKAMGAEIDADDEQLRIAGGFDHNFVINDREKVSQTQGITLYPCAEVTEDNSGRVMRVETTLPGVQFYAGNFMQSRTGKYGCTYQQRGAFCLETQYFPSAVNVEAFADKGYPKPIFGPDREYREITVYTFSRRTKRGD